MRYFTIAYHFMKEDGRSNGFGQITMQSNTYPNNNEILEDARKAEPGIQQTVVINIIEMNHADFQQFIV